MDSDARLDLAADADPAEVPSGRWKALGGSAQGFGAAWAVLAISLIVTGFVCYAANRYEQERVASLFLYRTDRVMREIQSAFGAQEAAVRAAAGLIEADDGFSRARWRGYFRHQPMAPAVPGLEAIGYAPRVAESERAAHEAQVREDGMPDYVVVPEGARPVYFPIAYLRALREPVPIPMGYDVASTRSLADVLRVSAGTGRVSGGWVESPARGDRPAPWLVVDPVYRGRTSGANPVERAHPQGFVVAAIDIADVMRGALGDDLPLIAFRIATSAGSTPEARAVESAEFRTAASRAAGYGLTRASTAMQGDREWRVEFAAFPAFRDAVGTRLHLTVIIAGLLVSGLLFAIAATIANTRRRAVAFAAERTRQLSETLTTLAHSEEQVRAVFDNTVEGIITIDTEGTIRSVNPATERIFGYPPAELLGRNVNLLMPPPHRDRHDAYLARYHETGEARLLGRGAREVEGLRKDGTRVPIDLSISTMTVGGQRLYCGFLRDISDRVRFERVLADNEHKLRTYIERSIDGVMVVDRTGRYHEVNPAACELFGLTAEELLERSIADVVVPEAENLRMAQAHFAAVVEHGESRGEVRLTRKGGGEFVGEINAVAIGGDRYLGIIRDVTARREAERELRRERERLEERVRERTHVLTETNRTLEQEVAERRRIEAELVSARLAAESAAAAKSAFLANMSHEIRTPLNALTGMAALLEETRLTPEQRSYLEGVRASGDTLLSVISDILDFSKIDSGFMELEVETFDLAACIEDSLDVLAAKAGSVGLELVYRMTPDVPPLIRGDRTRVRQVLVNLVGNAIKFTPSGEIEVDVTVAGADAGGTLLRFAVRDTGMGIAVDKVGQLFRPFMQADSSTTRRFGGTGLGLAICARLVQLMGGEIDVVSEEGRGSTFTFTIRANAVTVPGTVPIAAQPHPEFRGRRMLVVDDNTASLAMLADLGGGWRWQVDRASSVAEARELLATCARYDAIIADEEMPDGGGLAIAESLTGADAPFVVLLTPLPGRESRPADAYPACVRASVRKPIKPARLCLALLNALGGVASVPDDSGSKARLDPSMARRLPLSILVAEDSAINRQVAIGVLSKLGYEPVVVGNGREAVDQVLARPFDVVFMDLQMPEMDGLEAVRRIRGARVRQPRIVAMTANALQQDRESCLQAGMDDYVAKPVQPIQIQQLLGQWGAVITAERRSGVAGPKGPRVTADANSVLDQRTLSELAALDEPGKPSLRGRLIRQYLEETPKAIAEVRSLFESGDRAGASRRAHRLAGASASVGASGLADACRAIERSLASGEEADGTVPMRLDAMFAATREALSRLLDRQESAAD
ncbi:MAG: PAS domain S-box protein [Burkholderiales bacterium]